jgi:hypothetical protein
MNRKSFDNQNRGLLARGLDVEARVERFPMGKMDQIFVVRSDLVNGLPLGVTQARAMEVMSDGRKRETQLADAILRLVGMEARCAP